ncbi:thioredoxin family protein [Kribbella jiaozuonensis]|uniref:thioredoxin n=1 Tax=Kribbella jiaozuonensis TaxID=2575441 RepID=UPI0014852FA2|nr:thioredoxin [Kribbella jiaozuonensis]
MNHSHPWRTVLSRFSPFASGSSSVDPDEQDSGPLAALGLATSWLNSPPLTAAALHGRVVLVDFWTYTCVNWLRTLPYREAWAEKYGRYGLALVGVHTPEFDFEHELGNVQRAVDDLAIDHPVAIDNDYAIWTSFDNHYWPALYFVDALGIVRHHHFGEGEYEQSEAMIQALLTEAGATGFDREPVRVDAIGVEAAAGWADLWSPENYLGYERTENFASPNGAVLGTGHDYVAPAELALNHWALAGDWNIDRGAVLLNRANGTISYRFHARDVNLVLAPGGGLVPFQVRIDGRPPAGDHGADVDADGNGLLDRPRLYQLVRQTGRITDRTFEIVFQQAGVLAYAFTFG